MDLSQAREKWYELRNLDAPRYNNEFSYVENDWAKITRWVERVTGQLYVLGRIIYFCKITKFYYVMLNRLFCWFSIIVWTRLSPPKIHYRIIAMNENGQATI